MKIKEHCTLLKFKSRAITKNTTKENNPPNGQQFLPKLVTRPQKKIKHLLNVLKDSHL